MSNHDLDLIYDFKLAKRPDGSPILDRRARAALNHRMNLKLAAADAATKAAEKQAFQNRARRSSGLGDGGWGSFGVWDAPQ